MSGTAVYARKSVFREDSVSIESQIEICGYEARGENFSVYADNGFSGKDTSRPEYRRMMKDIQDGKIRKVIVYRLDRISRSILDFSNMMDMFDRNGVDFVSATEHFDTSSPMGRAMLNICIVFAQLERETIQQRVSDAYLSRSKKGFYMGGKIPYGYRKIPVTIGGIKTSMYEAVPDEAENIRLIYSLYAAPSATLGDVLRELSERNISRRGHAWNTARLSETMRNPVYTYADMKIYSFFSEQKSNIINPQEEFNGQTSLYLFKGENRQRKTWDLSGQNIVIAPHRGIVDTDTWLACRKKLLKNHKIKACKPKNSFLAGKIKCGYCGYGIVVRFSGRKDRKVRYFVDTGRTDNRCCSHKLPTMRADCFEAEIIEFIRKKLKSLPIRDRNQNVFSDEIFKISAEREKAEKAINSLLETVALSPPDSVAVRYIEEKIAELDKIKREKKSEEEKLLSEIHSADKKISCAEKLWDRLSFEDKRAAAELLVEKITVYTDRTEIHWNI